jgi:hypothetical protein
MRFSVRTVNGLKNLVNDLPNKFSMVEIGCYAGESTNIFLNSGKISKFYAIDPWVSGYDDNDLASNSDLKLAEKEFDKVISKFNNVVKLKDFSTNAILKVDELVDFVYIDANHNYDSVINDINLWKNKIKPNGFIGGHDYGTKHIGVTKAVDELFKIKKIYCDSSWLVKL